MKKILVILLAVLILTAALAEEIEWSSLTDDEITAIIQAGQQELKARQTDNADEIIAFNDDDRELILSNPHAGNYFNIENSVVFDALYTNNSDNNDQLVINGVYVNNWDTETVQYYDAPSGKKVKSDLVISLDNTDITSFDEIEIIQIEFGYLTEDYDYTSLETVTVYEK